MFGPIFFDKLCMSAIQFCYFYVIKRAVSGRNKLSNLPIFAAMNNVCLCIELLSKERPPQVVLVCCVAEKMVRHSLEHGAVVLLLGAQTHN